MFIVLDTNILFNDWQLRSAHLKVLLQGLGKINAALYIPEVVRAELVNKFTEELVELKAAMNQNRAKWERCIRDKPFPGPDALDVYSEVKQYEERLEQVLTEAGAVFRPYPDVSHEEIIDRILMRAKPFAKEGKGYRDYLIWKTIMELLDYVGRPVIFITKNTADFSDDRGRELHPELVQDLEDFGHESVDVMLYKGLDKFVDELVKPRLEFVEGVLEPLRLGTYPGLNLEDVITTNLNHVLVGQEFRSEKLGFRSEFETPMFSMADRVASAKVAHVMELSPELFIEAEARVECSFDVFIDRANQWIVEEDDPPAILNHDWTQHSMRGSVSKTLDFYVCITFNPKSKKVTSFTYGLAEE